MFIKVNTGDGVKRAINCFQIAQVYPVQIDQSKSDPVRSAIQMAQGGTVYVTETFEVLCTMIGDATNAR